MSARRATRAPAAMERAARPAVEDSSMKRRGRGFAGDEADVNAGDEADVSGDVPRAKTRAASRDA